MVKQQVNDYDYDYDNRINRHLSKCKEVLSESDYTLLKKYHTQMIIGTIMVMVAIMMDGLTEMMVLMLKVTQTRMDILTILVGQKLENGLATRLKMSRLEITI